MRLHPHLLVGFSIFLYPHLSAAVPSPLAVKRDDSSTVEPPRAPTSTRAASQAASTPAPSGEPSVTKEQSAQPSQRPSDAVTSSTVIVTTSTAQHVAAATTASDGAQPSASPGKFGHALVTNYSDTLPIQLLMPKTRFLYTRKSHLQWD